MRDSTHQFGQLHGSMHKPDLTPGNMNVSAIRPPHGAKTFNIMDLVMPPTQCEETLSVVCVWNCSCYIQNNSKQQLSILKEASQAYHNKGDYLDRLTPVLSTLNFSLTFYLKGGALAAAAIYPNRCGDQTTLWCHKETTKIPQRWAWPNLAQAMLVSCHLVVLVTHRMKNFQTSWLLYTTMHH